MRAKPKTSTRTITKIVKEGRTRIPIGTGLGETFRQSARIPPGPLYRRHVVRHPGLDYCAFNALAPDTISRISVVMAVCRALL